MKRIICLILALLLLCPMVYAKGDLKLILTATEGEAGDTVTVSVAVEDAPVTCSYKVVLTYDDKVLEPQKIKKVDSQGIFMENIDMKHEGKPAVNALAVHASKSFEGDCTLFTASFKILKEPAEASGTPINVAYTEFYDYDLKALTPDIESCSIKLPSQNTAPAPDSNPSTGTDTPSKEDTPANNDSQGGNKEEESTPDTPLINLPDIDKTPTGDWEIDTEKGDITHTKDDGTTDEYKGEISYDENDKPNKIELTDKDGKPAGSLNVTEKEDGTIKVEEQDLLDKKPSGDWFVDEEGGKVSHKKEDGTTENYNGKFIYDEEDKLSKIELTDKDGKPAGDLTIKEDENGNLLLEEQNLIENNEGSRPIDDGAIDIALIPWKWILPAAGILLIGVALIVIVVIKSKKEEK